MFIRRQDVIDRFAANFRDTADGGIAFQPPNAEVGLPITWEEHAAVMATFERTQMINMVITWAVVLAAGAYGFYHAIVEGRYLPFLVAAGAAFLFSFMLSLRDGLGVLLPFIQRREELLKVIETEALSRDAP